MVISKWGVASKFGRDGDIYLNGAAEGRVSLVQKELYNLLQPHCGATAAF